MRLTDDSIIVRRQVLKVMKRRGSATVAHEVDVAVRDLLDAPTCAERKEGLATLARIASGQDRARALQAIGEVEEGPKNEQTSCMLPELERSKTRILKR